MPTWWVICGSGRGVGKTHLAQRLCAVLPRAVSAKLGHGRPHPDGPPNYFQDLAALKAFAAAHAADCDHVVLEANALARLGRGDFIIYLRGPGQPRTDAPALVARAHLVLPSEEEPAAWEALLARRLPAPLAAAVVVELAAQQRFLTEPRPQARSKLWFVVGQRHFLGPGLFRLLCGVEAGGSLRAAARQCRISYRRAWDLVTSAETALGTPLLWRQAGGPHGGNSQLTPDGRCWCNTFARLNREVEAYANQRFAELLAQEHHS